MDDILKYWFLHARKRSVLRWHESNQICIRARLRGKSKRRAMSILWTMLLCNSTVERSIWQIPRTSAWFDLAYATYSDDEWYAHFRVSRGTFEFFVKELQNIPQLALTSSMGPVPQNASFPIRSWKGPQPVAVLFRNGSGTNGTDKIWFTLKNLADPLHFFPLV